MRTLPYVVVRNCVFAENCGKLGRRTRPTWNVEYMSGLLSGNRTTGVATAKPRLLVLRGQTLAIGVSAAVMAVQYLLRPVFDHSVYMLCAPALLACACFSGARSALTATLVMVVGGFFLDERADLPLLERTARAAIFLVLGLGVVAAGLPVYLLWRRARRHG